MKPFLPLFTLLTLACSVQAEPKTFELAKDLLAEKSYDLAAVEFRRFAMESEEAPVKTASYLYAGYAYLQNKQPLPATEMLDRAEKYDAATDYTSERLLLSAENARLTHDLDSALYYYSLLAEDTQHPDMQIFSLRRAAAANLRTGHLTATRTCLEKLPGEKTAELDALDAYLDGHDKSPVAGGLWGLIPGGGYFYSGEIANGVRSLILNSLFMYGMAQSADDEQWGAFAIISFFELTWYSGSIYGGIDAAHRYNQDRLNMALDTIGNQMSYQPEPEITVPLFKLKILF